MAEWIDKSKKMHQSGAKIRSSLVIMLSARTIISVIATVVYSKKNFGGHLNGLDVYTNSVSNS